VILRKKKKMFVRCTTQRRNMILRTSKSIYTLIMTLQIIRQGYISVTGSKTIYYCDAYEMPLRRTQSYHRVRTYPLSSTTRILNDEEMESSIDHGDMGKALLQWNHLSSREEQHPYSPSIPMASASVDNVLELSSVANSTIASSQYEKTVSIQVVPTTMSEAIVTFFASKDYHGPRLVVLLLLGLIIQRIHIGWTVSNTLSPLDDICIAMCSIVFWWFQEHFMHKHLLHSKINWIGKHIHHQHHERPYHHISIDPAPLMLGWFIVVRLFLQFVVALPIHLLLSATIAYGVAGLFYEWSHYIVHTRVRFPHGSYWEHIKNHHARHHLVDSKHWFSFSVTQIDDIFGTNPNVSIVAKQKIR
jgi:Fatty acid hydroxylase superfamily